jgi:hypothetical protein
MEILRTIIAYSESQNLPFVIIGGHAMSAHGIARQTADIDLLVPNTTHQQWIDLLSKLRYTSFQDDPRFARFKPDTIAAWPIDIMFVDQATFDKIYSESFLAEFGYTTAHVASALHMITLKIHALKYPQEHRSSKDYDDVVKLISKNKNEITITQLEGICLKYATPELFCRLEKDLGTLYD